MCCPRSRLAVVSLFVLLLAHGASAQIGLRLRTVTGSGSGVLTITTQSLGDCTEDTDCGTAVIVATGGTAPRTFAEVGSALGSGACTGISLASTGTVTKAPTTAGTCTFTARVTDNVAATYDKIFSIVVAASATYPAPWNCSDLGAPAVAGSSSESGGTWTLTGSGIIFGTSDQGHHCNQAVTGSQQIVGRVTACTSTGTTRRCQLEYRSTLAADATNLICGTGLVSGVQNNLSSWRLTTGGASGGTVTAGSEQYYQITVDATANQITCNYSADGVTYHAISAQTITVPATYYLGMSASEVTPNTSTATLTTVSVSAWAGTPPVTDFGGYRPLWQGYGIDTRGGRGGLVCAVNSLADTSTGAAVGGGAGNPDYRGTFRYCAITRTEPRIIVFETSGTIAMSGDLKIVSPYLTVAGQTAPSPGINFKNRTIYINTHDVVWQHTRQRTGTGSYTGTGNQGDVMYIGDPNFSYAGTAFSIVLDHVSLSWGSWTNLGAVPKSQDWQLVDSIVGQGLAGGTFFAGAQPNALAYYDEACTVTFARNLFIGPGNRNPWIGAGCRATVYNNVSYNIYGAGLNSWPWGNMQFVGTDPAAPTGVGALLEASIVSNVAISGPNTGAGTPFLRIAARSVQLPWRIYMADNSGMGLTAAGDQWAVGGVWFCSGTACGLAASGAIADVKIASPDSWYTSPSAGAWTSPIVPIANTGTAIRDAVLAHVGARPQDRDSVDTAWVAEVLAGTGYSGGCCIANETLVGGQPTIAVHTQTYTVPTNPTNPGTCGTTAAGVVRTIIECDLETKAQAIE